MEEQELSTFYNIPVLSYDLEAPPVEIPVSIHPAEPGVEAGQVLKKVCKHHGLRKENIQYFTLVDGRSRPKRRFKPEDILTPPFPELCLKKWTFTAKEERQLVDDPSALHLLHLEAVQDIKSGRIKPTSDQLQKLEEYMEPEFCLKNQYILCCHNVDLYWSVVINNVRVCKSDQNNNSLIPADEQLALYITLRGLEFHKGSSRGFVAWRCIRSWTAETTLGNIQFDITRQSGDTWCVKLETQQTQYLLAAISEILKSLQTEDSLFFTCMINKDREKDQTTWDNALYDPTTEGHTTESQACQGHDSTLVTEACIDLTKLDWT